MNRRSFFKALGAAVAIVTEPPAVVRHIVHTTQTGGRLEFDLLELDAVNAIAFNIVSEILPEHRNFYRTRALAAAHRFIASQQYRV